MIVVAATQNAHKIKEINAITKEYGFNIISRKDAGIPDFEIEENGGSFEENSLIKAMEIYKVCGKITIADDSGLIVDYLNGAPGVYSSRFAGEEGNDCRNNEKLLKLLKDLPFEKRTAKFVSVITMVFSEKNIIVARGECKGHILYELKGDNGFGYDPVFAPLGYDRSFGELDSEVKNRISHRAKALEALAEKLAELKYISPEA